MDTIGILKDFEPEISNCFGILSRFFSGFFWISFGILSEFYQDSVRIPLSHTSNWLCLLIFPIKGLKEKEEKLTSEFCMCSRSQWNSFRILTEIALTKAAGFAYSHCSHLDIYISQKTRLCVVNFEVQFQTSLEAKLINFLI